MTKITRKELEKLVAEINEQCKAFGDDSVYVLNWEKYSGGYKLQRYTANKEKLLRNNEITETLRCSAAKMFMYLLGIRNALCLAVWYNYRKK